MRSHESCQIPSNFSVIFKRRCLDRRIIDIRKISQEKHVNRMMFALKKKEMRPPQDLYASVSNPKWKPRNINASFTTQRSTVTAETSTEFSYSEKNMNFPTELNCNYTVSPELHVSDSHYCSEQTNELIPVNSINENGKNKMEITRNSSQQKKSPLKDSSGNGMNSPKENADIPVNKVSCLSKKPTKYQKNHSTFELRKHESKYDKVNSISEITLDSPVFRNTGIYPSSSANISENKGVETLESDADHSAAQYTKNESRISGCSVDQENKAAGGDIKKVPKVSKIPVLLTRLSRNKEKNIVHDTAPQVFCTMATTSADIDFINHVKHDSGNNGGSIPKTQKKNTSKKIIELANKKRIKNRIFTIIDDKAPYAINDSDDCSDGERYAISLKLAPKKISSVSLWLESLDDSRDNETTSLHSESFQANMNSSNYFVECSEFELKTENSKGPENPPEISNITYRKYDNKEDDLESEKNSLHNYYEFDDTDQENESTSMKGSANDDHELTEETDQHISSHSNLDPNFKNSEIAVTTSKSFPSLDKPNYNNPFNFECNTEENNFDNDEKVGSCFLDIPKYLQTQRSLLCQTERKAQY